MNLTPNNPERWEGIWDYAKERSPLNKRLVRSDEERITRWDRMADGFARRTSGTAASQRRDEIMGILEREGALKPGIRILDVGGGPGNWAIPLSAIAGHVTVVEPSSKMLEILETRVAEQNIRNITTVHRRWEDVDVDEEGLRGQYDLVFASMTPGVNNRKTLEKLMRASRRFCYMSGFSGMGRLHSFKELWPLIFNEPLEENPGDIIFPFNLLYAMGYRPKLTFSVWEKGDELKVPDAIRFHLDFLWDYSEPTEAIRRTVEHFVKQQAVDGMFSTRHTICQGHMLWEVN